MKNNVIQMPIKLYGANKAYFVVRKTLAELDSNLMDDYSAVIHLAADITNFATISEREFLKHCKMAYRKSKK